MGGQVLKELEAKHEWCLIVLVFHALASINIQPPIWVPRYLLNIGQTFIWVDAFHLAIIIGCLVTITLDWMIVREMKRLGWEGNRVLIAIVKWLRGRREKEDE